MKQLIRRHPYWYIGISLASLWVIASLLLRLFGRDFSDALWGPSGYLIVYAAFGLSTVRQRRMRDAKLKTEGKTLAYLRYPRALPGSLSSTWNRGTAILCSGQIVFQAAVYESLEPSGRPTTFTVVGADNEAQKLTPRQAKYVTDKGLETMTLKTTAEDIEIAAFPTTMQDIRKVVLDHRERAT